ncbi:MAG: peptide chain release factor N(5)-glutamine methyltransferase [Parachlamydiales bacterium]|jgi:release factor glutamine methyltransferase
MIILKNLLARSIAFLKNNNIVNSDVSAEVIICHVLKIKKNDLYFHLEKKVTKQKEKAILLLLQRRANREPIDYILKNSEFYNLDLFINRSVLIPRQETELLVDLIIKNLEKENLNKKILLDVCCGSGCIGLALKKRFPDLKIYLSDISKKAISVSKINAKRNNLKVFFKEGDLFAKFSKIKADYIVCNPPYVSEEEYLHLDKDVKDFEPEIALVAKKKGLDFYVRIEKEAYQCLKPQGKIFLEIGHNQKNDIQNIFLNGKWKNSKVYRDYSGKDRFFFVEIE